MPQLPSDLLWIGIDRGSSGGENWLMGAHETTGEEKVSQLLVQGSLTAGCQLLRLFRMSQNSADYEKPSLGVFHLSCWILGVVAFSQVMSVGVALAVRPETTVVERVVKKYIAVPQPVVATPPQDPVPQAQESARVEAPVTIPKIEIEPISPHEVLANAPVINEPVAERLVMEAREARIRSDHMQAVIKLEEALRLEPDHPAIIYEMATNFEVMGIYDKATEQYLKLNALGPLEGGSLWKKASAKLARGIVPESKEFTSLGVVRLSPSEATPVGERRGVVLPVSVSPNADFNSSLLETKVHFFEKQGGEVKQVESPEQPGYAWLSGPVDWADGEEMVEIWYHIPPSDRQQQHIFGERVFHGYVAELYYAGELVDMRAHPRPLLNKMRGRANGPLPGDAWDPDIDPVLESLEQYEPGDPLLPQLPTR